MKRLLFILGIVMISIELALYFFWYKELKFMEFFVILAVCHLANSLIIFGYLTEKLEKEKKELISKLTVGVALSFFLIVFLNSYRVQSRIDNDGILTKGIVTKKEYGAGSVRYLKSEFSYQGVHYESQLTISDLEEFENIKLGDTVLIKFVKEHPKMMNRTERILKEQATSK